MTFSSYILYAKKIVFSKTLRTDKSSSFSHGKRSFFGSVICMGLSLIPLVIVISVTSGMYKGISSRMINLFSQDISVSIYKDSFYTSSCESFLSVSESFLSVEGVKGVFPEVRGMVLASGPSYRSGSFVRGIEEDTFLKNKKFASFFKVIEGNLDLSGGKKAIIGEKIAEDLNLHTGDTINLISLDSSKTPLSPKVSKFKVSGIVSSGYQELDALWVFIPIEDAFSSIARSSLEFFIGLETSSSFSDSLFFTLECTENFIFQDEELLGSYAEPWQEVNQAELENFSSTNALLSLIMMMIVIVASISISSSVLMLVMERKREIAILKCMGASSIGITFSFVLTGTFAGLLGVSLGLPVGILISFNINWVIKTIEAIVNFFIKLPLFFSSTDLSPLYSVKNFHLLDPSYYLQEIPCVLPLKNLILIALFTLFLSAIVSIIPSLRAGKEKPLDTLRKM